MFSAILYRYTKYRDGGVTRYSWSRLITEKQFSTIAWNYSRLFRLLCMMITQLFWDLYNKKFGLEIMRSIILFSSIVIVSSVCKLIRYQNIEVHHTVAHNTALVLIPIFRTSPLYTDIKPRRFSKAISIREVINCWGNNTGLWTNQMTSYIYNSMQTVAADLYASELIVNQSTPVHNA